jgi:formylglycine-generating enzyme required for sulfatase activity
MQYEAKVDNLGELNNNNNNSFFNSSTGVVEPIFLHSYNCDCDILELNNKDAKLQNCRQDVKKASVKSTADNPSINNVNYCLAKTLCENSGAHLITNNEWMTIARNIEMQAENWTGGDINKGSLKNGNTGRTSISNKDSVLNYGKNRSDTSAKLVLDNGSEIWDLSGNVEETVDQFLTKNQAVNGFSGAFVVENDFKDTGFGKLGKDAYTTKNYPNYSQLTNSNTYGIGKLAIGAEESSAGTYNSIRVFRCGGSYYNLAGVFNLDAYHNKPADYQNYNGDRLYGYGFRCVTNPI